MFRYDNPDALLTLLLAVGAYTALRAIEDDRVRWYVLTGAVIGLAFLTKQLQALVVVPGFALALLVAGAGTLWRRIRGLLVAGAALVASAGWWVALVELRPEGARPYIGGSEGNSFLDLTFGYNGLGRITGEGNGPGGGFGPPGGGGGGFSGGSNGFTIYDGASLIKTLIADSNGAWSFTTNTLTIASPPLDLYLGSQSAQKETDPGVKKLGTVRDYVNERRCEQAVEILGAVSTLGGPLAVATLVRLPAGELPNVAHLGPTAADALQRAASLVFEIRDELGRTVAADVVRVVDLGDGSGPRVAAYFRAATTGSPARLPPSEQVDQTDLDPGV